MQVEQESSEFDNLGIPGNFKVGQAVGGGDYFLMQLHNALNS